MGLDVGNLINNFTLWVNDDSIFSSLVRNPFSAAMILTIIVIIIIIANLDIKKNKLTKTGIYTFIIILLFLFIHYSAVVGFVSNKYKNVNDENIISQIEQQRKENIEITPPTQHVTVGNGEVENNNEIKTSHNFIDIV
jgi:hypothetical protein